MLLLIGLEDEGLYFGAGWNLYFLQLFAEVDLVCSFCLLSLVALWWVCYAICLNVSSWQLILFDTWEVSCSCGAFWALRDFLRS